MYNSARQKESKRVIWNMHALSYRRRVKLVDQKTGITSVHSRGDEAAVGGMRLRKIPPIYETRK